MSSSMQQLIAILDLEQLEHNLYRGHSPQTELRRVFGGQAIAQALVAAQRTVRPDRFVHSLHGYFILAGDTTIPILYQVERIRDGGSFTTRRVTGIQNGRAIFLLDASFQADEPGLDHQVPMPHGVPRPHELLSQRELLEASANVPEMIRRFWARERPLEIRPVNTEHYTSREPLPPAQNVWVRTTGLVPDDRNLQAAVLAYLSDMTLLDTATFAHGRGIFDPDLQVASLDHAMWFHRPHALDGWLLYSQDSPSSSGARGFSRGALFGEDGTLVASVAQEGLIRLRSADLPKK